MRIDHEQIQTKLYLLLEGVEGGSGGLYTDDIRQLIKVREWKIAVEVLCELLLEAKGELARQHFELLVDVATTLGVEKKYWQTMRVGPQ